MNINWKRILLLIGFIAAVILIGYLLYFLFLKPTIPPTKPGVNINIEPGVLPGANVNANIPTAANINGALPGGVNVNIGPPSEIPPTTAIVSPVASGGLTKTTALTTTRVYQSALAADGKGVIYYDRSTGLFYTVSSSGKSTPLSDKVFYEVENITWAPNRQKAILEYPDGSNIVYDFSTNQQITLPNHWKDFGFSPNSSQIVFKSIGTSADNRWLAVANVDGTKATKIEIMGDQDLTVHPNWSPNNQVIAMYREYTANEQQSLYFIGLNKENFKSATLQGNDFQGQWSTQGDRLLYSVYSGDSDYKPTLWIVEAQGENIGQNRRNLGLETWAAKCSFADNNTIYCAVPQSLSEGAGMFPDDLDNSPSDIYKIDLISGFKSKIAIPEGNQNINRIMISEGGNNLYFESKTDGRIYSIKLR